MSKIALAAKEAQLLETQDTLAKLEARIEDATKDLLAIDELEELSQGHLLQQENLNRKLAKLRRARDAAAAAIAPLESELDAVRTEANKEHLAECVAQVRHHEAELLALAEKLDAELATELTKHMEAVKAAASLDGVGGLRHRSVFQLAYGQRDRGPLARFGEALAKHRALESEKQMNERLVRELGGRRPISDCGYLPGPAGLGAPGPGTVVTTYDEGRGVVSSEVVEAIPDDEPEMQSTFPDA